MAPLGPRLREQTPKWKTMLATGIAIYPLISIIPGLLHGYTDQLPKWLAQIVVMVVLMPLATFVTVPLVTRIFYRWL